MEDLNEKFTGKYAVVILTHFGEIQHGSYTFKDAHYMCKIIMNNYLMCLAFVRREEE